MEFILGMLLHMHPQNGLKRAPEEQAATSNNLSTGMMDRYKIKYNVMLTLMLMLILKRKLLLLHQQDPASSRQHPVHQAMTN